MKEKYNHIVLSQDFFPKIGGAHSFLYEVYKRWNEPVYTIIQDYSTVPNLLNLQQQFDSEKHGSLALSRGDIFLDDLNIIYKHVRDRIGLIFKKIQKVSNGKKTYLHTTRAFPEGAIGLFYKLMHPNEKIKVITYAHGEDALYCQTSKQIEYITKLVYQFSDLIIANSKSSELLVRSISNPKKIKVVCPGVDFKKYQINPQSIEAKRREWEICENSITICSISRLSKRKNHISILEAMLYCKKRGININSIIASEGSEKENLIEFVKSNDLTESVRFTGYLSEEDKILTFCASDIHIMPSIEEMHTTEGFGIVFMEASAAGIPSISGNVGGQTEAVLNGKTGITVDGNDLNSISEALMRLATDAKLRKDMGYNAKQWAENFDWNLVHKKIESVVSDL